MNAKRLLKLADFLDALPRQKFNYSHFVNQAGKPMREALKAGKHACGTTACAVGWMPAAFPRLVAWRYMGDEAFGVTLKGLEELGLSNFETASRFFDLPYHTISMLFDPGNAENPLGHDATPKQVAKYVRECVSSSAHRRSRESL